MFAVFKKTAPLAALAAAAILSGCAVTPVPYHTEAYYADVSPVYLDGTFDYDGFYHAHYGDRDYGGYHGYGGHGYGGHDFGHDFGGHGFAGHGAGGSGGMHGGRG